MSRDAKIAAYTEGSRVRVRPEYDIPAILRPGGAPSEGVVDHILDSGTLVVVVDGKSVPYQPEQVERVG